MSEDTRPVRASEQLDWEKLAEYLRRELSGGQAILPVLSENGQAGLPVPHEMTVTQFPGGHSNLTYDLRFGDFELVLRRPPFGPVPPRAHDMAREYRVLTAVHPHFPLAPKPYLLCEDASVIGSVFYVMERRRGLVIRTEEPASFTEETRRRVSGSMIDTLAALHAIDVAAHGLDALGKPAGFVARQIKGWTERWHGAKTSDVPDMESLAQWLDARIPADPPRPTLVHGDYKLDNVMLDESDPSRLVGVFDWEMSAIGDPLVDVGILLCYWVHAVSDHDAIPSVTKRPGWFTRDEILARYASASGIDVGNIAVYEVFAVFKLAVVIQQIYARFVRGQTDDPRFAPLGERVADLARIASKLASQSPVPQSPLPLPGGEGQGEGDVTCR
ncbi:MAG TPA: phosphotransferase family protein [Thermoanaerobaculia bacterium]|nr:phosphotransferase family protein [Thermoanaerobaculia bacterium]